MELRHLRYFIAVAEELHFGRAAERLGISQPPLSQQIQALEEEIGARLFERTNRRVELTDAGRLFLDESRQVLAQVDKAVLLARRAHLGELGELKIGFTSSAPFTSTIPSSIHAFRKAYPEVHLDLQEMSSRQVLRALLEESLQVGVIRPLALPDTVHSVELFREPLVAVLRADHPLAAGSEDGLAIAALAEEPFVFFPRSYGTGLYDQVIALTRQAGFSPRIAQEASEAMTIIGLVSAGLGVSILPASFRRTRVDGVVYRTLGDPEATTAVWLVRRQNEGSPLALSFIDLVTREAASLHRR
ncbi:MULTISPECIES: LysR family transcriptional regulator [Pseudomonas aeruginosa group]|uniref:LysR family transcriptional regulator n=3 Tax=Pseudomonas aeruginosa group TaxID=136841 RepID=A0ABD7K1Q1_PSEAI|nr:MULTISPECIES: LysR family transcriptional regulator [Pseudomonas aeruginosa group]KFF33334.1 LysR family transcriptional regulator [Pseudomonas aeruginosa VRFPA01]VTS66087.1 LysR family transcriptional regulator [Streptococcus dysgalactiae subsp. equisimilis]ABR84332.1 putative transcriptional regulator [Pseudomonas aeruginosa PA7]AVK03595.1 lysR substrate binding domain protein [Pseudomonas paraeruginosa]AVR70205.1 LysR family transcriptional regulator [Pseudomonas paraeruginosa]